MKFLSLLIPDGILLHLFGPHEVKTHNQTLYRESGVEELFQNVEFSSYCVLGDQGYMTIEYLVSPCNSRKKASILTPEQLEFNQSMQRPRDSVENGFMRVTRLFRLFHDHFTSQIGRTQVTKLNQLAVFFTNIRSCLNARNQVADYFNIEPLSLLEYLRQ